MSKELNLLKIKSGEKTEILFKEESLQSVSVSIALASFFPLHTFKLNVNAILFMNSLATKNKI